jgi:hypothetical protein
MNEIIRTIFHPAVIIPLSVMAIPISAIIGHYYLKIQKLKLSRGAGLTPEQALYIQRTYAENQELKERVANLETIITGLDKDLLGYHSPEFDSKAKNLSEIHQ